MIKEHKGAALQALNDIAQTTPGSQYKVGDWVWLKAKHLTLPYASAKLAPKHHRPFKIMREISLVAYQLKLPKAWTIHDMFHSSLLTPYKETREHGAQFQCPPPELIGNKEEYKVEQIINHRYHGKQHQLQYLIQWKDYSVADDTTIMSLANSANIPSPTPSSFTVNMDIAKPLPTRPQAEMPVVHKQDHLSVPSEVMATLNEFSELLLSPRSMCTTLEGHSSPSQEELLHIAQGLAGVAQKNEEVSWSNHEQFEVLQQQGEALAKHEMNAAHLEETYKHWM